MSSFTLEQIFSGDQSKFEIVPLGTNCHISHSLRKIGLRFSALPFDWNVTPIQSAIALIDNGFSDFLSEDNFAVLPATFRLLFDENGLELEMKDDIITPVICRKYNILYPHDFPKDYTANIKSVIGKYQKRIARLDALMNSNKHVIFVHHEGDLNDWQKEQYAAIGSAFSNQAQNWQSELKAVLERKYPALSYSCYPYQNFVGAMNMTWQKLQAAQKNPNIS